VAGPQEVRWLVLRRSGGWSSGGEGGAQVRRQVLVQATVLGEDVSLVVHHDATGGELQGALAW